MTCQLQPQIVDDVRRSNTLCANIRDEHCCDTPPHPNAATEEDKQHPQETKTDFQSKIIRLGSVFYNSAYKFETPPTLI